VKTAAVQGAVAAEAMLVERVLPRFDATLIEHRVVDGDLDTVYEALLHTDFLRMWAEHPVLRGLAAVRATGERLVSVARGEASLSPLPPQRMELNGLPDRGDWVRLADDRPREFVFGVIGRFWGGQTHWQQIDATEFAGFDRPGFAKIANSLSLRPYGDRRTLVSYEACTQATDPQSRRDFLLYWRIVRPGVRIVMRSMLAAIAGTVETRP